MTSWHRKNGNSWTLLPPWSPGSFPSDYFCITCGWPKSAPARAFASLLLSAFCYLIAKQIHQRRNKHLCHTIAVHPPKAANGKKGTLDIWVISKNSGPWKSRQNVKRGKKKSLLWIQTFQTQSWRKMAQHKSRGALPQRWLFNRMYKWDNCIQEQGRVRALNSPLCPWVSKSSPQSCDQRQLAWEVRLHPE